MALISGVYQPGADAHAVGAVTSDNLSFISAASGRRLVGFSAKGTAGTSSGGFAGALCLGAFALTTARAVQWSFTTNETAEGGFGLALIARMGCRLITLAEVKRSLFTLWT